MMCLKTAPYLLQKRTRERHGTYRSNGQLSLIRIEQKADGQTVRQNCQSNNNLKQKPID